MEEEEEGRKGAGSVEEKEDEGRNKKDMHEKLNKLFSQPADPWASTGVLWLLHKITGWRCDAMWKTDIKVNFIGSRKLDDVLCLCFSV